jgi:hypothetical protein
MGLLSSRARTALNLLDGRPIDRWTLQSPLVEVLLRRGACICEELKEHQFRWSVEIRGLELPSAIAALEATLDLDGVEVPQLFVVTVGQQVGRTVDDVQGGRKRRRQPASRDVLVAGVDADADRIPIRVENGQHGFVELAKPLGRFSPHGAPRSH